MEKTFLLPKWTSISLWDRITETQIDIHVNFCWSVLEILELYKSWKIRTLPGDWTIWINHPHWEIKVFPDDLLTMQ